MKFSILGLIIAVSLSFVPQGFADPRPRIDRESSISPFDDGEVVVPTVAPTVPPPSIVFFTYRCSYERENTPGTSGTPVVAEGVIELRQCTRAWGGYSWVPEGEECGSTFIKRNIPIGDSHNLELYGKFISQTTAPNSCELGYQVYANESPSNSLIAGRFWYQECVTVASLAGDPPAFLSAMGRGAVGERGHRSHCYFSVSQ